MNEKKVMLWCFAGIGIVAVVSVGVGLIVSRADIDGRKAARVYTAQEVIDRVELEGDGWLKGKTLTIEGKVDSHWRTKGVMEVTMDARNRKTELLYVLGAFNVFVAPPIGREVVFEGTFDRIVPRFSEPHGAIYFKNCRVIR